MANPDRDQHYIVLERKGTLWELPLKPQRDKASPAHVPFVRATNPQEAITIALQRRPQPDEQFTVIHVTSHDPEAVTFWKHGLSRTYSP